VLKCKSINSLCDIKKANKIYRKLSNTIHGKISTFESLAPERFSYNKFDWSEKIKARLKNSFPLIRNILEASLEDLNAIPYIKERRSIMIKNADEEFISG
jgi:hypothetical protein